MHKKESNKSLTIKRTPFISDILDSDGISNKAKKSFVNFIDTVQNVTMDKLMAMHAQISEELPEDDYLNPSNHAIRINGMLLTIIQDEFKERGGST